MLSKAGQFRDGWLVAEKNVKNLPWQDEWFPVVVSVGADSQVHFLGVAVGLEGFCHTQDWVGRSHLNASPPGGAAGAGAAGSRRGTLLQKHRGSSSGQGHDFLISL